jgi:hypothetical protein
MTSNYLGFYANSQWRTYMDITGGFYLTGNDSIHYLAWSPGPPSTLTIRGSLNADDITAGSLRGINVAGSSVLTSGTCLTSACSQGATTLYVQNTADFSSSGGSAYVIDSSNDRNFIYYSTKTATTLEGVSNVLAHNTYAAVIPGTGAVLMFSNGSYNEFLCLGAYAKFKVGDDVNYMEWTGTQLNISRISLTDPTVVASGSTAYITFGAALNTKTIWIRTGVQDVDTWPVSSKISYIARAQIGYCSEYGQGYTISFWDCDCIVHFVTGVEDSGGSSTTYQGLTVYRNDMLLEIVLTRISGNHLDQAQINWTVMRV